MLFTIKSQIISYSSYTDVNLTYVGYVVALGSGVTVGSGVALGSGVAVGSGVALG